MSIQPLLARLWAPLVSLVCFGLVSQPALATDDWLERAFRSSQPVAAAPTKTTARKTAAKVRTAKRKSQTTWTEEPAAPAKATRTANAGQRTKRSSKPVTIRAARYDDAQPSLRRQYAAPVTSGNVLTGIASYYWQPQPVASGGRFNPEALTAAHKTLPFGTRVRVTRIDTGRSVEVTINDRGPYIAGRIIDLSLRAARDIGMTNVGITPVRVTVLGR